MPNATYGISLAVGGLSIQQSVTRSGDHPNVYEVSLAAGETGTLSTRTNDTDGTITMDDAGHSITTGATIDIYWSGGMRYGVTVGTVSGTSVPISGGAGDNLPAQDDPVTVDEQVIINSQIDGDNVQILGIVLEFADSASTDKGHVDMQDSGSASIEAIELTANVPQIHDIAGGATNVFTGNVIETTHATNGSSTASGTLKILSLEDSTP